MPSLSNFKEFLYPGRTLYFPNLPKYTTGRNVSDYATQSSCEGGESQFIGDNLLWLEVQPRKITDQKVFGRGSALIDSEPVGPRLRFLLSYELGERQLSHVWNGYNTAFTQTAESLINKMRGLNLAQGIGGDDSGAMNQFIKDFLASEVGVGSNLNAAGLGGAASLVKSFINRVGNTSVTNQGNSLLNYYQKLDTAMTYVNTDYRDYSFNFNLADTRLANQTNTPHAVYENCVLPIDILEYYSSPGTGGNRFGTYDPPSVFSIKTLFGTADEEIPLINVEHCALTGIVPSWSQENRFVHGYPRYTQLMLKFKDIEPWYRERLTEQNVVTTTDAFNVSDIGSGNNDENDESYRGT